jgi:hypothetical protein
MKELQVKSNEKRNENKSRNNDKKDSKEEVSGRYSENSERKNENSERNSENSRREEKEKEKEKEKRERLEEKQNYAREQENTVALSNEKKIKLNKLAYRLIDELKIKIQQTDKPGIDFIFEYSDQNIDQSFDVIKKIYDNHPDLQLSDITTEQKLDELLN